jgi:hypothetical protein
MNPYLEIGETDAIELLVTAQKQRETLLAIRSAFVPPFAFPNTLPFSNALQLYAPPIWHVRYRYPDSRVARCHQLLVDAGDGGMSLEELFDATGFIRGRHLGPAIRTVFFQRRGPPLALVVGYSTDHLEAAADNYAYLLASRMRDSYQLAHAIALRGWILKQQGSGRFSPQFFEMIRKRIPRWLVAEVGWRHQNNLAIVREFLTLLSQSGT